MIDPEQLKQYLSVVQRMNFTKAANDLFISHSTISRTISRLEAQFGVQLMVRNNRSVSLTPAGQYLAERGKQLMSEIELLEADMCRLGSQTIRRLRVDMINFFSNDIFRHYEQFHRNNPSVDMSIQYCPLEDIRANVMNGDADIGITFSFALDNSSKLEVLPILDGEFVIVCSSAHPLAGMDSVDIFDPLLEQPIVIEGMDYPFVTSVGQEAEFHKRHIPPRQVPSMEALLLQVKANMGIAILPEHIATQAGSGCSLLSIDGVDSTYHLVMFWLRNTPNDIVQPFVHLFRND